MNEAESLLAANLKRLAADIEKEESCNLEAVDKAIKVLDDLKKLLQKEEQRETLLLETTTPEALGSAEAALTSTEIEHEAARQSWKDPIEHEAARQSWKDPTLAKRPSNDYELFCSSLDKKVNDDQLSEAFSAFPSFKTARVERDKKSGKSTGYGFVSFGNESDFYKALQGMNGILIGIRKIRVEKSKRKNRR